MNLLLLLITKIKKIIKTGNERVVEARLADANFFGRKIVFKFN